MVTKLTDKASPALLAAATAGKRFRATSSTLRHGPARRRSPYNRPGRRRGGDLARSAGRAVVSGLGEPRPTMTSPPLSAIAVRSLVRESYRFVFGHLRLLLRLGWVWLLLAWLLGAALEWLMNAESGRNLAELVALPLLVAFAVAWHRASLISGHAGKGEVAGFGRREFRYLGMLLGLLAILLLFLIFGGVLYLLASSGSAQAAATGPTMRWLIGGLLLAGLFFGVRFILVFPAIAVGDQEISLKRSWQLTRGNGSRLFLAFLATCLPLMLLKYAVVLSAGYALVGGPSGHGFSELAILMPLFLVLDFLNTAAAVGFMSQAYRAFTGRRDIAGP
jgi:hypothetical protein